MYRDECRSDGAAGKRRQVFWRPERDHRPTDPDANRLSNDPATDPAADPAAYLRTGATDLRESLLRRCGYDQCARGRLCDFPEPT